MARTTISIPDDLKKRMDKVREEINWSAIAAQAFELKLGELAERRKEKTMDTVVERLRASKIKRVSQVQKEGYALGADWAKDQAEFDELERVASIDVGAYFVGIPMAPYSSADWLAFEILGTGEDDRDHTVSRDFWDSAIGDLDKRLESEDFLSGFCNGAADIYRRVADQVDN